MLASQVERRRGENLWNVTEDFSSQEHRARCTRHIPVFFHLLSGLCLWKWFTCSWSSTLADIHYSFFKSKKLKYYQINSKLSTNYRSRIWQRMPNHFNCWRIHLLSKLGSATGFNISKSHFICSNVFCVKDLKTFFYHCFWSQQLCPCFIFVNPYLPLDWKMFNQTFSLWALFMINLGLVQ